MGKRKKTVFVVFPNKGWFIELSVNECLHKNKRRLTPSGEKVRTKNPGTLYQLCMGRTYEVVVRSSSKIYSGKFKVSEKGIEVDKSEPPPIAPILLRGN
ncbi:hypothetical protein J7L36_00210 [bacterium]|nr:hypothetical protein [bacterium]